MTMEKLEVFLVRFWHIEINTRRATLYFVCFLGNNEVFLCNLCIYPICYCKSQYLPPLFSFLQPQYRCSGIKEFISVEYIQFILSNQLSKATNFLNIMVIRAEPLKNMCSLVWPILIQAVKMSSNFLKKLFLPPIFNCQPKWQW